MASIKGNGLAKKVLDKNLASKVCKTNGVAYLSYLSAAAFSGLAAYTAVKVKNKIQARHDLKEHRMQMAQRY